ncbi:hypothetical protein MWMV17_MWMV17_01478 [Acinetobacter calcoaceticus]|uniref:Uncharacterized protein n=1 Tax=Acinetobacter calcoaceticus DSM 30006 = CIP 81.8 TaxID=981331 RepID=A0ABN0KBZ9_ACICA|nr:hypothetical protein [Acinetobacter calcoaceticus]ENW01870.1 hypothetical protein F936_00228 [Acinetobacter calcoaceticus DSM 30006 = CIP 81.8]CAI3128845.1 hypothetical protein MWMV17_MWMV17_01478 [Acinetobacter calcoaceticus]SUU65805.1 Uncharacterised protein [Acinetobacter calcoaceticus]
MPKWLRILILFIFSLYVVITTKGLVVDAYYVYKNFHEVKQQNCELIGNITKQNYCNQLIAYKYKMILFEDSRFKSNEYYISFYKLNPEAIQRLSGWLISAKNKNFLSLVDNEKDEFFFAQPPAKKVWLLPHLKKYCLNSNEPCLRKRLRISDNQINQQHSYIVYGPDDLYWQIIQNKKISCKQNFSFNKEIALYQESKLYVPKNSIENKYLICYDSTTGIVRLTLKTTSSYLR